MVQRTSHRAELGEQFSEGARQLWLAIIKRGWSQATLREKLGVAPGVVSRWLYGDKLPSIEWAAKMERLLKIPARLWAYPPKQPFQLPGIGSGRTGTEG